MVTLTIICLTVAQYLLSLGFAVLAVPVPPAATHNHGPVESLTVGVGDELQPGDDRLIRRQVSIRVIVPPRAKDKTTASSSQSPLIGSRIPELDSYSPAIGGLVGGHKTMPTVTEVGQTSSAKANRGGRSRRQIFYQQGGKQLGQARQKTTSSSRQSTTTTSSGRSKVQGVGGAGLVRTLGSGGLGRQETVASGGEAVLSPGISGGFGTTYPRGGIGGYPTYPSGSVTFSNYAGTGRSTVDSVYLGFG